MGQKVVDSVGALFYSAQLNADVGLGFGGEVTVLDNVKATAIIEKHAYMLRVNENGFDYGLVKGSNAGITVGPVNVYSTGYTDFESYVTGKHTTFCGDSHFVGFSAGVYVGAGASIQIGWDLDYYNNKVNEIWR